MEQAPRRGRIFYGWWIVGVCIIVLIFHAGAAFYAFGRFMPTLIEELGSSTTAISAAISIYMLVLGLTAPVVGKLTDKYGPKQVLLWGGVIAAAGLMLLSLTSALWHLYILYLVVGIGMSGAGTVPVSVAISNWFTKRRGLAMGVAMAGISLGAIAIAPLAHYLIEGIGWRGAYLALGVLTAVLIVPPVMLVMKTRPEDKGLLPYGARPAAGGELPEQASVPGAKATISGAEGGWSVGRAMKTLPFWLVLVTFFFAGAGVAGVLQHEVRILQIMGIPLAAASFALGLTGGIGGMGKVAFGFVADRMSPKYTAILCIALQLVGVVILMFTHTTAMVWVFVIVFGFAMGGNITVQPLLSGYLFGMASFGTIFGWVLLAGAVGSSLGPVLMGVIFDASGSYALGLMIFVVAYAVAITALLFAIRPKLANSATL